MEKFWKELLNESVKTPEILSNHIEIDIETIKEVTDIYPMRINPYFLDLMKNKGVYLSKQVVPDIKEICDTFGLEDPLAEERDSPVPNLTHRYPDRVLFLVSGECGVYCRFCTRKRKLGRWREIKEYEIEDGIRYIKVHKEIKDVLLSGGDPLLLSDERLEWIIGKVREISHVEIIRIGTRVPSVLPQRITTQLVKVLNRFHPLYVITHFNHPAEINNDTRSACQILASAGIPLGNQTVLLKGINNNPKILAQLMRLLLKLRVRPYYLHQGDLTKGTNHFRTSIEEGLHIMEQLRGRISGLAVPTYVVDLPGGGGKVPLLPEYIVKMNVDEVVVKNYEGRLYRYPQPSLVS